jgi:hypothetical protein
MLYAKELLTNESEVGKSLTFPRLHEIVVTIVMNEGFTVLNLSGTKQKRLHIKTSGHFYKRIHYHLD